MAISTSSLSTRQVAHDSWIILFVYLVWVTAVFDGTSGDCDLSYGPNCVYFNSVNNTIGWIEETHKTIAGGGWGRRSRVTTVKLRSVFLSGRFNSSSTRARHFTKRQEPNPSERLTAILTAIRRKWTESSFRVIDFTHLWVPHSLFHRTVLVVRKMVSRARWDRFDVPLAVHTSSSDSLQVTGSLTLYSLQRIVCQTHQDILFTWETRGTP